MKVRYTRIIWWMLIASMLMMIVAGIYGYIYVVFVPGLRIGMPRSEVLALLGEPLDYSSPTVNSIRDLKKFTLAVWRKEWSDNLLRGIWVGIDSDGNVKSILISIHFFGYEYRGIYQ